MINNKKINALIFAGRKKYLKILIPQLLQHDEIDKILIFKNTECEEDIEYINCINNKKIIKIDVPFNKMHGFNKQYRYYWIYKQLDEENSIYFKIDDDIIYIDKNTFYNIVDVMDKTNYIFYYPMIVNNPICNCLFDSLDINFNNMYYSWKESNYALKIHNRFLDGKLNRLDNIIEIDQRYNYNNDGKIIRPSINFIGFRGKDIIDIINLRNPEFMKCDEQFMTKDVFEITGRKSCIAQNSMVSHYSFYIQNEGLKKHESNILQKYKNIIQKEYKNKIYDDDVTIFTFTFFVSHSNMPQEFHNRQVFKTIQCGSDINVDIETDYKDNIGENISRYNKFLNEMTGMFWLGKNIDKICNTKYIGTMHYRRYLDFDQEELSENTIICSNIQLECDMDATILEMAYKQWKHTYKNWVDVILNLSINYNVKKDIIKYITTEKNMPNCNMFIMSVDKFKQYFNFIYPILKDMVNFLDKSIDTQEFINLSNYQKRFYGFIMERITAYWIIKQRDNGIKLIQRRIKGFAIRNFKNGGETQ